MTVYDLSHFKLRFFLLFFFTVDKSFSVELPVDFASKIKTWIFTEQVEINLPLCKWNAVSNC